jgi:hypothetical protein
LEVPQLEGDLESETRQNLLGTLTEASEWVLACSLVWIFCVLKCQTNINRQRGKNPIHENATRMLQFGVPILTVPSHDPIAIIVIDPLEKKTLVTDSPLWTFVHITRAGSIHRAEQQVDALDPVQQKSIHDWLVTKHCSYVRRFPLRLCVCVEAAGKSMAAGNFTTEEPSLHPTTPSNAAGFPCLPPWPTSGPCRGPFYQLREVWSCKYFQLRVAAIRRSRVLAGIVPDSGGNFPLLGHIRKNAQAWILVFCSTRKKDFG